MDHVCVARKQTESAAIEHKRGLYKRIVRRESIEIHIDVILLPLKRFFESLFFQENAEGARDSPLLFCYLMILGRNICTSMLPALTVLVSEL